jgi:hypothetical protein
MSQPDWFIKNVCFSLPKGTYGCQLFETVGIFFRFTICRDYIEKPASIKALTGEGGD